MARESHVLHRVERREAELYSLSSATQEAIYLRKVCLELGFLQINPTIMYEDYQVAVALPKEIDFAIAANISPFAGVLLSNDKASPLAT